jgi:hypothetical protein
MAKSGRSSANGIAWSMTNEQKTNQFSNAKAIVKLFQHAQGGRALATLNME